MKRVCPTVSSSTTFVILTLPTFHAIGRFLLETLVTAKMLGSACPRNGSSRMMRRYRIARTGARNARTVDIDR
jgi:hypothetical protein